MPADHSNITFYGPGVHTRVTDLSTLIIYNHKISLIIFHLSFSISMLYHTMIIIVISSNTFRNIQYLWNYNPSLL